MTVSLELLVAGVAGGIVGGYFALRRWVARRGQRTRTPALPPRAEGARLPELRVGDVVEIGEREYWLTSGYSLREAGTTLCEVFSADEARLVLTLGPQGALFLGRLVALNLPRELPARLDHLDRSFSLKGRFPVEVVPHDRETNHPEAAQWGRYEDGDEHTLWVLHGSQGPRAILCRRVPERDILHWGNAGS